MSSIKKIAVVLVCVAEATTILKRLRLARFKGWKFSACCSYAFGIVSQVQSLSSPFLEDAILISEMKEEKKWHGLSSILLIPSLTWHKGEC